MMKREKADELACCCESKEHKKRPFDVSLKKDTQRERGGKGPSLYDESTFILHSLSGWKYTYVAATEKSFDVGTL